MHFNRSMSSSREVIPSAGIRQCAWKDICWEGATCVASKGCSLLFATVLISLLDWFQTTASHWLPLHSSIKAPSFPVLCNILYVFPAQGFSFFCSGGQISMDCAVFHPAYSCLPSCSLHGHHDHHILTQGTSPRSAT